MMAVETPPDAVPIHSGFPEEWEQEPGLLWSGHGVDLWKFQSHLQRSEEGCLKGNPRWEREEESG